MLVRTSARAPRGTRELRGLKCEAFARPGVRRSRYNGTASGGKRKRTKRTQGERAATCDVVNGNHVSSRSMSPAWRWWIRWLSRQAWYGTSNGVCVRCPIKLSSHLRPEKLPCPQSCPITKSAQATVPCASHSGGSAHGDRRYAARA